MSEGRTGRFAVLTLAVFLCAGPLRAQPYTEVIVFGDSLSDAGNTYVRTFGFVPDSPPYYDGRFSNGPTWAEQFGLLMGVDLSTPSVEGGANYANGGATTEWGNSSFVIPNVGKQVTQYLGDSTPNGAELFVLWAGANDFFDGQRNTATVVANMADHITTLAGAGASDFLVPNLPPLGQTPRYAGTSTGPELDLVVDQYNAELASMMDSLAGSLGVTFFELDIAGLFDQMLADPGVYGIVNVSDVAYDESSGSIVANPNEYLFWDDIHPTFTAHGHLASAAYALITPGPAQPGDADRDGDVDGTDLATVGINWSPAGADKAWAEGDFDEDGDVDGSDLAAVGLNWNPAGAAVPEPASLALMGAVALAMGLGRPPRRAD